MDYSTRKGIAPVSWDDFHALCKGLAKAAAPYRPEWVLAVGRGGYYPGTLMAHILRANLHPIYLTRRVGDVVTYSTPRWLIRPPRAVKGRRVLVVDEISSSGETLQLVKDRLARMDAAETRTAVLYAHSLGAAVPDYIGFISDALILNPWDRVIFQDGAFQIHPEYAGALEQQDLRPDGDLFPLAGAAQLAKEWPGDLR
ncbi:MAG TPA: phosphoribosyltransferase family protein [Anaerolineaceae bacterium]|nr:phosphoribosyltransferase family protein [Anaerolineaceae bacterium]